MPSQSPAVTALPKGEPSVCACYMVYRHKKRSVSVQMRSVNCFTDTRLKAGVSFRENMAYPMMVMQGNARIVLRGYMLRIRLNRCQKVKSYHNGRMWASAPTRGREIFQSECRGRVTRPVGECCRIFAVLTVGTPVLGCPQNRTLNFSLSRSLTRLSS